MNENSTWQKNYEAARAFFESNGHFPAQKENRKLNNWARQWWRDSYLASPDRHRHRASKLTVIGFIYLTREMLVEERWQENYRLAKKFFDENNRFPACKEEPKLVEWLRAWWRRHDRVADRTKADLLASIGFGYQSPQDRMDLCWQKYYAAAKAFYEKNGHFPTPSEDRNVYAWAYYWVKKMGNKYPDKVEQLLALGWKSVTSETIKDEFWQNYYGAAKAFFARHGRFPRYSDDRRLRQWAVEWWGRCAENHPDKARLLTDIGFEYKSLQHRLDEGWSTCYSQAKSFYEENGRFPTADDNDAIYRWAHRWWQKCYLREPAKYQSKADSLMDLGFNPEKGGTL